MKTKESPAVRPGKVRKLSSSRLGKQCINLGRLEKDQFVFQEKQKRSINEILHY